MPSDTCPYVCGRRSGTGRAAPRRAASRRARPSRSGCATPPTPAFAERGWFGDDFSVSGGGATTWSDDVEGADDNGWTLTPGTFTDTTGAGWHKDSGTQVKAQYYLVEWRNYEGFDKGLQYAYDTTYQTDSGAWKVEKLKYNAPGALVWYRDTTWGNSNQVTTNTTALPSYGSKGGLLIVDSHFDPLGARGPTRLSDPTTVKNLPSRPQSSNAAFGLAPTKQFNECQAERQRQRRGVQHLRAAVGGEHLHRREDLVPGIEVGGGSSLFARDVDASTVIPSKGNVALHHPGRGTRTAARRSRSTGPTSGSPCSAAATRVTLACLRRRGAGARGQERQHRGEDPRGPAEATMTF